MKYFTTGARFIVQPDDTQGSFCGAVGADQNIFQQIY